MSRSKEKPRPFLLSADLQNELPLHMSACLPVFYVWQAVTAAEGLLWWTGLSQEKREAAEEEMDIKTVGRGGGNLNIFSFPRCSKNTSL